MAQIVIIGNKVNILILYINEIASFNSNFYSDKTDTYKAGIYLHRDAGDGGRGQVEVLGAQLHHFIGYKCARLGYVYLTCQGGGNLKINKILKLQCHNAQSYLWEYFHPPEG